MLNYYLKPKSLERDVFDEFFSPSFFRGNYSSSFRTDITETENEYHLDVELPGYGKDDVKISLKDGYLTIEAEKHQENNDENKKYISREIYHGRQSRSYYVGNIDREQVKASFNNGILQVSIPKEEMKEEEKSNFITIE